MLPLNKQIFIFINIVVLLFLVAVFITRIFDLSVSGIFEGYSLKLIILAGILFIEGLCVYFWGDAVINRYNLPKSLKELACIIKEGIRINFKENKIDLITLLTIFVLAVLEVVFYNYQISLNTEILPYYIYDLNPDWSDGADNIFVVSDSSYYFVPLFFIFNKIINILSLFAPFITIPAISFGLVITMYYCVFRLGMGRGFSLVCTALIMVSSTQLDHVIPFWDKYYFRAFFVLSLVFIAGILIKKSFEPIGILLWAIVSGIYLGHGLMFRADMWVFSLLIILTIVFLIPRSDKINIQLKIIAVALFLTVTTVTFSSCPGCGLVISPPNNSHAIINATSIYEQQVAGLKLPKYDWNHLLADQYTSSLAYAQTKVFNPNILYKNYGPIDEYSKLLISNFPADLLAKFYGVVLRVLEIPFSNLLHPIGMKNENIVSFYSWRGALLSWFSGLGIWLWMGVVIIIGTISLRRGIFCIIVTPPLMLLPSISFEGYYYFYLEFISYWTLGFILNHFVMGVFSIWKRG